MATSVHEGKIRAGNILISVHTVEGRERDRARNIFERSGAEDIASASEATV